MVHQAKNTVSHCSLSLLPLVFLITVFYSCKEKTSTVEQMKVYEGPIMEVDSLQTLFSDNAILRVKFNAGKELDYQSGDKEFLKGVRVEFFNEKGVQEAVLTSHKGFQEKNTGIYRVEEDVVVQNFKDKKELHTEKLFWDSSKKRIYTPETELVRIKTPREVLTGKGLEAAQDFSWYKIKNPSGVTYLTE
ncbi:MAG TPA: LPS export ABC transporter periplasmic protein LptC [Cytophagaceae bacterium]|jgi:LPS export ABC transporter protein LptC|nr:LPS export ABC transporter periplasmic protein LptC [Cytophagaceae bacterium]